MEIIAKTKDGVLINATTQEVNEILNAVLGAVPKELNVGDKVPAIDYAQTIKNIKELSDNYAFKELLKYSKTFTEHIQRLNERVKSASLLENQ